MNFGLTWKIAARYFRGKGTANAVPLLSRISMVAIAVCSAAMVIVFSVFNGLDGLVRAQYKTFCPDIKISAARGKFFNSTAVDVSKLAQVQGVQHISPVIEDNALASDEDAVNGGSGQQKVVMVKGVENRYMLTNELAATIIEGVDTVSASKPYTAIMGRGVADGLRMGGEGAFNYIELYYANPAVLNPESDPLNAVTSLSLHPSGIFELNNEFDDKYIFAPIELVQEFFNAKNQYSAIEITADSTRIPEVKAAITKQLGGKWKVEDIIDQNKSLFMVMGGEKWIIYMILLFVLLIASFNMVGALSMLAVTKKKDVAILNAMGASSGLIRSIFLFEGALWSVTGGLIGVALGITLCLLQQQYGFVKMDVSFMVDAFPVKLKMADVTLILSTIICIGLLAAWYPAIRAARITTQNLRST